MIQLLYTIFWWIGLLSVIMRYNFNFRVIILWRGNYKAPFKFSDKFLCRAWKVGEKHENWGDSRNFLNSQHFFHDALRLVEKIWNIQKFSRNGLYSLRYGRQHSGALKMAATANIFENSNRFSNLVIVCPLFFTTIRVQMSIVALQINA